LLWIISKVKVYSNRDKFCFLSHNLPNQIRTTKHSSSDFTNRKKNNQTLLLLQVARLYSTSSTILTSLNPFFITGLTDAEGSFVCIIRKSTGHRLRWRAEVVFQIALHPLPRQWKKDLELLKQIQAFFWRNWNYSK